MGGSPKSDYTEERSQNDYSSKISIGKTGLEFCGGQYSNMALPGLILCLVSHGPSDESPKKSWYPPPHEVQSADKPEPSNGLQSQITTTNALMTTEEAVYRLVPVRLLYIFTPSF